ncbi:hypothetical protein L7F22_046126 [Adiantum nelumboides]|nr:hypothetical protein [Adiantum nelumboides]
MSPFGNTFSSLMHVALFEPPLGVAVLAAYVQALAVLAPSHASQQRMVVPVAPTYPTMPQPPANSPRVVSPAPGARVPIATFTPSLNANSNTRKRKLLDIWYASEMNVLLDLYEDKWISLNRGNFKAKHWTELTRDIQTHCAVAFTDTHCLNKGLGDGFTGEDFVNLEVVSLAEDEDMATTEGEGGLPKAGEGDVGVLGVNGTRDGVDEDTVPGLAIGQTVRGQRVKKPRVATALEGLGASLEHGVGTFAKAFERVELRRMELEEKRLEVQFQIVQLLAPRTSSPPVVPTPPQ